MAFTNPFLFYPRVKQTITTTGTTGVYDLSAGAVEPTFTTFAAAGLIAFADGTRTLLVYYSVDDGVDFEVGVGTFAQATQTLTRTAVLASSNANAAVNWGVGDKTIALINYTSGAVATDAAGAGDIAAFPPSALGSRAICIGSISTDGHSPPIAGSRASAGGAHAISIKGAADGLSAIAIGGNANVQGEYSIALGDNADTSAYTYAIALGSHAWGADTKTIAIGANATAYSANAIAIGEFAYAHDTGSIALGKYALGTMSDAIAWGPGNVDNGGTGAGANALMLYLDKASAAGTAEVMRLPTTGLSPAFETFDGYDAFAVFYGKLIGHNSTDYKVFDIVVAMHRASGTTALLGTPTITAGVASAGAGSWTVTAAVNGDSLDISVDAAASKWAGTLTMAWSNT